MRKLIYFHGFGSSGEGGTVRTLKELLPDWDVIAPDIPVDPKEALPFLKELCQKEEPDVIVGTSMGGMYAQQIRGFKRICVNPAFDLPQHTDILYEGTFDFFNPRKNGKTIFTITPKSSVISKRWRLTSLTASPTKTARTCMASSPTTTPLSTARTSSASITRTSSTSMVSIG